MRGPHHDDVFGDDVFERLDHAAALIELNHAAIDGMLTALVSGPAAESEHGRLAVAATDLERLGEGLIRTSKLIAKVKARAEPAPSLEWELERVLANRYAGRRGISIRSRNGIKVGTVFKIDDFWREDGVFVGVVWKTPKPRFDWLTPLELTTWTRPLPPIAC